MRAPGLPDCIAFSDGIPSQAGDVHPFSNSSPGLPRSSYSVKGDAVLLRVFSDIRNTAQAIPILLCASMHGVSEYLAIDSGGNVSDLVLARNCCLARMLLGEAELVSG